MVRPDLSLRPRLDDIRKLLKVLPIFFQAFLKKLPFFIRPCHFELLSLFLAPHDLVIRRIRLSALHNFLLTKFTSPIGFSLLNCSRSFYEMNSLCSLSINLEFDYKSPASAKNSIFSWANLSKLMHSSILSS